MENAIDEVGDRYGGAGDEDVVEGQPEERKKTKRRRSLRERERWATLFSLY